MLTRTQHEPAVYAPRGALRGFYTQRENNRSARQQAENIASAIQKGAGEEPPVKSDR